MNQPAPSNNNDLEIRMGVQEPSVAGGERILVVDFGKQVSWVGFTKQVGADFAEKFLERLKAL